MNSKQRVRAAIARQPVDRVPLGLYAVDYDIVERVLGRPTYVRNQIAVCIALWEGRREEVAESFKKDSVELYRKLDCVDLIIPKEATALPPKDYDPDPPEKIGEDTWEDRQGRILKRVDSTGEIICVHDPVQESRQYTLEDFEYGSEPAKPDPSVWEALDYLVEALGEERYIASYAQTTALTLLGGAMRGLMRYATQPDVVEAAARRAVEEQNASDACFIRPGTAGVFMEQDFAGTNGPLVSPESFRRQCLPHLKRRIENVKKHRDQVIFHCCGNTVSLMGQLAEAGIDAYQSLQTTAGMDIAMLLERFGGRLAFWGGVAVETLIGGSPEEVRRQVRRVMEQCARRPGFILGPSHSIAKNTRYDTFMAMLDEFVRLRDRTG